MNWEKFLLYLLIGFVIAIIFIIANRKIKVFTEEGIYIWGSSMVFAWPIFVFFGIIGSIFYLFAILLKLITGGYKRNVSSR